MKLDRFASALLVAACLALPAAAQEATFRSRGQSYRIVTGARALTRDARESLQEALTRAGISAADLLEAKGAFVLFRLRTAAPRVGAPGVAATFPVAVNDRTGGYGVVLGTITVQLRTGADARAVGSDHGLQTVLAPPRLSMAFYRVAPGQDVQAAAAALAQDPRVALAEIEVKEHVAEPN